MVETLKVEGLVARCIMVQTLTFAPLYQNRSTDHSVNLSSMPGHLCQY